MSFTVIAIVFAVIFLAELPDKSMVASLVLGTRFRPLYVWLGAAAAFSVHVVIAVAAGGVLSLLPHRLVETVVAVLFIGGAAYLLFGKDGTDDEEALGEDPAEAITAPTLRRVAGLSFAVIFVGEWGDITQIATANLAAKYHQPFAVGIGAILGLWTVLAVGVLAGAKLVDVVPLELVRRITGLILGGLGIASAVAAIRG